LGSWRWLMAVCLEDGFADQVGVVVVEAGEGVTEIGWCAAARLAARRSIWSSLLEQSSVPAASAATAAFQSMWAISMLPVASVPICTKCSTKSARANRWRGG